MEKKELDCLLIGGSTANWDRGWTNTRWVTNFVGCQLDNYSYVVFPAKGEITVLGGIMERRPVRRARSIVEDVRVGVGWPRGHPGPLMPMQRLAELSLTKCR